MRVVEREDLLWFALITILAQEYLENPFLATPLSLEATGGGALY